MTREPLPVPSAFLDELRARTLLSALISRTVKLTRAGREWKACCPFHSEKTPSFTVNDEKGFYHCFGCSAHGDVISWMTEKQGLPFMDAVKELAQSAGMIVPAGDPRAAKQFQRPGAVRGPVVPSEQSSGGKGGGKLNRTETVTVRLDPKLNYLCELAARAQRRTKSSFIEWAIADSLGAVSLPEVTAMGDPYDESRDVTLREKASHLWQVDEPDRTVALALIAPALLNHEEQLIWRLVRENGYLWRGRFNKEGEWSWEVSEDRLIRDRLRDTWDRFKAVAMGEQPIGILPHWRKSQSSELDDDVPF